MGTCIVFLLIFGWVSQARKELLESNFADIWHRHEEVGFIAKCDGSEENKIILRDGKRSSFFWRSIFWIQICVRKEGVL